MTPDWFRRRGYRHLDTPVGRAFAAKATDATFVARHDWTPLISYEKREKRYKAKCHKTVNKPRKIKDASHRDACILSYYAARLTDLLDARYRDNAFAQRQAEAAAADELGVSLVGWALVCASGSGRSLR